MNQSSFELTAEQKQAVMLQINEHLYKKGKITKTMYEIAKEQILTIKQSALVR